MTDWSNRRADQIIGAAIFASSLAYLACWPRDFYVFDEGLFLYEAKRVFDGQVMYRDFFEIVTPGSLYLIAGLYALFGVSLETARAAMAVVHGLIGVLIFVVCRRLGVRRALALVMAMLHLTLGYPAMTIASPHWMSSAMNLLLLLLVIRAPCATVRRAAAWGAVVGLLLLIQQQRGIVMASGIALLVAWDAYGDGGVQSVTRRLAGFAAGAAVVVVPVMLWCVITAGLDNVVRALILHPIRRYPRAEEGRGGWGFYVPQLHPLGFIISNLPLLLPIGVGAVLWQWRQGLERQQRRPLAVTVAFGVTGLLSVSYNPNYVHFVQIAPLWFVLAGFLLERATRRLDGVAAARTATAVALAVLVLLTGVQLTATLRARRAGLPVHGETAFGRVDFANADEVAYVAWLTALLHRQPTAELFAFSSIAGFYLLTGTDNPTRFQIMVADYTERDQLEEIVSTLDSKRVPYLLRGTFPGTQRLEPLHSYVQRHYEPVTSPFAAAKLGTTLYRRRPELDDGPLDS